MKGSTIWNLFHWNQSSTKNVFIQISFIPNLSNKPGVKHENIWKSDFRAGTVYHPYTIRIPPVYLRIPPYTLYKGNTKVIYRILPYTSVYFRIPPYTAYSGNTKVNYRILPYTSVYFRIPPYTSVYRHSGNTKVNYRILPYTSVYHRIPPYTTRIPPVYHPYTTRIPPVYPVYI